MLHKIVFVSLIVLIALLGFTCKKIKGEDDKLSISKNPYAGKRLRVDGYYYYEYDTPSNRRTLFFYNNGISLYGGTFPSADLLQQEAEFANGKFYSAIKNDKLFWGVFQVDGDKITFERWYPSSGGPTHAYVRAGKILNDTTFQITESYRMQGGNKTEASAKDEVYHFKKFSPKPDSTNVFVP